MMKVKTAPLAIDIGWATIYPDKNQIVITTDVRKKISITEDSGARVVLTAK